MGYCVPAAIARKWLSGGYGCTAWYLLMSSSLILALIAVFFFAYKCYKKRMRNDSEYGDEMLYSTG
jgi:hypothetical protein